MGLCSSKHSAQDPTIHHNSRDMQNENDDEEPLLVELFSRLPDAICRHIFAFRFHSFQTGSDLKDAVDKYLKGDDAFQRIQEWDVSQVEDFSFVFSGDRNGRCISFNDDISTWNVSRATSMMCMFYDCEDFNADISRWDVGNVRYFHSMFRGCREFNQDLSKWNVGKANDLRAMFCDCTSFTSDVSKWNVAEATSLSGMFYGCSAFCSDVSNWNIGKAEDMSGMFFECLAFSSDVVSNWNTINAFDLSSMFRDTILLVPAPMR